MAIALALLIIEIPGLSDLFSNQHWAALTVAFVMERGRLVFFFFFFLFVCLFVCFLCRIYCIFHSFLIFLSFLSLLSFLFFISVCVDPFLPVFFV